MSPPFLRSALLDSIPGIRHGFFTRQGGVSSGLYESLNVGLGSKDDPALVTENRTRVCRALGADALHTVYQIHSARVILQNGGAPQEADGHVTHHTGQALGILTADCVPVLLAAEDGSEIAAVHAGWKGTVGGILEAALQHFSAPPVAAIGPAIAQASYEVGQDVFDAADAPAFFVPNGTPGKYQFDLVGLVEHSLRSLGVERIDTLHFDTYDDETRFFSYRRTTHRKEADYGRQISAIVKVN